MIFRRALGGDRAGTAVSAHDIRTPLRLVRYCVRLTPGWTALQVSTEVVGTLVSLLTPLALAGAVDVTLNRGSTGPALAWLASLLVAEGVVGVLAVWASAAGGTTVTVALRRALTGRVLLAGLAGQRRFAAGDLTSRMVEGAAEVSGVIPTLLSIASAVVLSVGAVVALLLIDWTLAAAFAVCVPLAYVLMRRFVVDASALFERYQQLQGELSARLVEALSGTRTIRAAGTVTREVDRVLVPLPDLTACGRATWAVQRRTVWKLALLVPLTEVLVLAVGGLDVSGDRISAGEWIAVAGYVGMALGVIDLVDTLLEGAEIRAGLARVSQVLELPDGPGGSRAVPSGPGRISFRSVTIRMDDELVLDGIDLDIPGGVSVALVGRSGAGKSTLAALAGGLLAPDVGEVLLDGAPLHELRRSQLRSQFGYAFERPAQLGETVHSMIAYGSTSLSREQVERAAESVCAATFVRRLPQGFDTPLAQAPFSGGELQRLGLARAVAEQRRVLILDDATSSLDTATEAQVTATLRRLHDGSTRLLVAHRVTTAAHADLVVWLADGRIRAVAPHHQLWRRPEYRAVFGAAETMQEESA